MLASEMLDEIYQIQKDSGERVSNVVVMGTGEPLDNYDALVRMIEILTHAPGLDISQRNVTVSTCGIVPKMYELAEEKLQITLALSLHATTDEKRRRLMPIANKYGMKELMDACRNGICKTNVATEYLIKYAEVIDGLMHQDDKPTRFGAIMDRSFQPVVDFIADKMKVFNPDHLKLI